ncbi:hypothetical protein GOODEAATRI_034168 [Goodea atripinnis]|uniref:Uncharacterized protein n=1 Tax=Goodea atripinnis TaxID=208336 RepID=A0ABV0MXE6_9TELE
MKTQPVLSRNSCSSFSGIFHSFFVLISVVHIFSKVMKVRSPYCTQSRAFVLDNNSTNRPGAKHGTVCDTYAPFPLVPNLFVAAVRLRVNEGCQRRFWAARPEVLWISTGDRRKPCHIKQN